MSDTPLLGLPLMAAAQAQKHVTHNEALMLLDMLVQLAVLDKDLLAPPAAPAEGARYLIAGDKPTGAWAGWAGRIVGYQDGAWRSINPKPGWLAYVADEADLYVYSGDAWASLFAGRAPSQGSQNPSQGSATEAQNLTRLGIGTAADAANPFAAKLNKALWTALGKGEGGDGDLRYTLNKEGAGNTLSLLLQSGWSGRAEFGLVGSDDLSLRVSPDGGVWANVFSVDRRTGVATFDRGTLREEITVFTASGTWAKPDWARTVTITAMGGGGGGGGARRGAAGSVRNGGGGGGAGALNSETFSASEIGATLTVTVGAGGTGAPAATTDDNSGFGSRAGGTSSVTDGSGFDLVRALGGGAGGSGTNSANGSGGAAGSNASIEAVGGGGAGGASGAAGSNGGNGLRGSGGGGAGGGLTTGNAAAAGRNGGTGYAIGNGREAPGGGQGSGGWGKRWARGAAGGGGGGVARSDGAGGTGGNGGEPGGGGGGGGASLNGFPSGAGGDGGRGEVWIIARG